MSTHEPHKRTDAAGPDAEGPSILRVAIAQINTTVGDLSGNARLTLEAHGQAVAAGARLVVFPELTLTGYPPEDLLLKPSFLEDTAATLLELAGRLTTGLTLVGYAGAGPDGPRNCAALIAGGQIVQSYAKCTLPNYGVFDEKRYFTPGRHCPVYCFGPWRLAVNICEDIWGPARVAVVQAREGGANLMANLSASPYHMEKGRERENLFCGQARRLGIPILYSNLVGGQDELVFDGQSLAAGPDGRLLGRAPQFVPHLTLVDLTAPPPRAAAGRRGPARHEIPRDAAVPAGNGTTSAPEDLVLTPVVVDLSDRLAGVFAVSADAPARPAPPADAPRPRSQAAEETAAEAAERPAEPGPHLLPTLRGISHNRVHPAMDADREVYSALMLGLRDYVRKNGFGGVVIGLSGGIDSALTAVIAADALGAQAVAGISMPSLYSSAETRGGARQLAERLGMTFHEIPIQTLFQQALCDLQPLLGGREPDETEENMQARLRGLLLMAFSNKLRSLVLATGNKSEVAVGYCTLYGDMVGGYSVLKDVFKTHVYRLARWRNAATPAAPPIPRDTLERPPSAELKPDQRDSDSLPPYEVLDPIVRALVEEERSPREIVARGFDRATVDRVYQMIQGNEYKRRQAAPGIKITPRAFGRDRRYPLTNRYRPRT